MGGIKGSITNRAKAARASGEIPRVTYHGDMAFAITTPYDPKLVTVSDGAMRRIIAVVAEVLAAVALSTETGRAAHVSGSSTRGIDATAGDLKADAKLVRDTLEWEIRTESGHLGGVTITRDGGVPFAEDIKIALVRATTLGGLSIDPATRTLRFDLPLDQMQFAWADPNALAEALDGSGYGRVRHLPPMPDPISAADLVGLAPVSGEETAT